MMRGHERTVMEHTRFLQIKCFRGKEVTVEPTKSFSNACKTCNESRMSSAPRLRSFLAATECANRVVLRICRPLSSTIAILWRNLSVHHLGLQSPDAALMNDVQSSRLNSFVKGGYAIMR